MGGWTPSRGFWIGMAAVGLFSLVLIAAGAFASGREPEAAVDDGPTPTIEPVQVTVAPRPKEPPDDLTQQLPAGVVAGAATAPVPAEPGAAESGPVASIASASPTPVASSWSSTPVFDPPAPAPALTPAAIALAGETETLYGIDVVLEGQDWGADEAEQVANIGAVAAAFESLPLRVTSSVASSPHGTLAVLSNREGRTLDGWKPYGGTARSFYTNSDQGPGGYRAAHEIVLVTGSRPMTVAHEMIHAWTFRDVAPDEYVLALLGDESASFMEASGWTQVGSDDDVRAAAREPWETVNALFDYRGPELRFENENGNGVTLEAANPLEAMAMLGAIYYARPATMPLPAWTAVWDWFDANLS
jgi:hypothetical protein